MISGWKNMARFANDCNSVNRMNGRISIARLKTNLHGSFVMIILAESCEEKWMRKHVVFTEKKVYYFSMLSFTLVGWSSGMNHSEWNARFRFDWLTKEGFLPRLNRSLQIFFKDFLYDRRLCLHREMIYISTLITCTCLWHESSCIRFMHIHFGWFIDGQLYKLALSSEASIELGNLANCTFEETKAILHVGW